MPTSADAMAAATSIMRAQQIVLAAVDGALRPFGLTFARYEGLVLLLFSRRGTLPLGIMGQRLMIHPASVTNIIDRLENQGLVRRRPHPTDGRTTLAEITEEGRRLATEATAAVNDVAFGLGGLSGPDTEDLQTDHRHPQAGHRGLSALSRLGPWATDSGASGLQSDALSPVGRRGTFHWAERGAFAQGPKVFLNTVRLTQETPCPEASPGGKPFRTSERAALRQGESNY